MRDINAYTKFYEGRSFEEYQVEFRRKKILEIIENLKPLNILEIGCGMEPIFKYLPIDSYESITIVEPSREFCENAGELSQHNKKVRVIQGFLEECTSNLEGKFGFILCSSLLHELEHAEDMLESIKSICQKSKRMRRG